MDISSWYIFEKSSDELQYYFAPNSVARSADACTASIIIPRIPPLSITCRALIVVPPGDVTSSLSCPGCFPVLIKKILLENLVKIKQRPVIYKNIYMPRPSFNSSL